jgi:hypothetical protein
MFAADLVGNGRLQELEQENEAEGAVCFIRNNTMLIGGNIYDKNTPNQTASVSTCCAMCKATPLCTVFTFGCEGCTGQL